jgi:hypothetical protein
MERRGDSAAGKRMGIRTVFVISTALRVFLIESSVDGRAHTGLMPVNSLVLLPERNGHSMRDASSICSGSASARRSPLS